MSATVLLENLNQQYLVIGNGKLVKQEHILFGCFSANSVQRFVSPKRYHRAFLYYGAFGYFLIYHFEIHKINLERHIGTVSQLRMEIVFAVVDVNAFQDKLYSETLSPDMLYNTLVLFVNGFQKQACQ